MTEKRLAKVMDWLKDHGEPTRDKRRPIGRGRFTSVEEGDVLFSTLSKLTLGRGWTLQEKVLALNELAKQKRIGVYHNGLGWHIWLTKLDREVPKLS